MVINNKLKITGGETSEKKEKEGDFVCVLQALAARKLRFAVFIQEEH